MNRGGDKIKTTVACDSSPSARGDEVLCFCSRGGSGFGFRVSGFGYRIMKTERKMDVWEQAMEIVVAAHKTTAEFPAQQRYGLASQMQRAPASIPAKIAEGYGRLRRGDYVHPLSIVRGSLAELETHIAIVVRLDFIQRADAMLLWNIGQHAGQMLTIFIQSLKQQEKKPL